MLFDSDLIVVKVCNARAVTGSVCPSVSLVPKSTTLDDPELTVNGHYALCYITHMYFGAHKQYLNDARPVLSAAKM